MREDDEGSAGRGSGWPRVPRILCLTFRIREASADGIAQEVPECSRLGDTTNHRRTSLWCRHKLGGLST